MPFCLLFQLTLLLIMSNVLQKCAFDFSNPVSTVYFSFLEPFWIFGNGDVCRRENGTKISRRKLTKGLKNVLYSKLKLVFMETIHEFKHFDILFHLKEHFSDFITIQKCALNFSTLWNALVLKIRYFPAKNFENCNNKTNVKFSEPHQNLLFKRIFLFKIIK